MTNEEPKPSADDAREALESIAAMESTAASRSAEPYWFTFAMAGLVGLIPVTALLYERMIVFPILGTALLAAWYQKRSGIVAKTITPTPGGRIQFAALLALMVLIYFGGMALARAHGPIWAYLCGVAMALVIIVVGINVSKTKAATPGERSGE